MKPILFLTLLFALISSGMYAQAPGWAWAKSVSGANNDYGTKIATDADGNLLVIGDFASPTITFGTTTLTNSGIRDIFIVKYDASGNVLWAKSVGGASEDQGYGIATDANRNVLVIGYFASPTITFGTTTLTNAGGNDIFIVKYNPSGTVLWAKSVSGANNDEGFDIATDANSNVLVTGTFESPTITFGTITLTNAGLEDIFMVKYEANGNVLWAKSAGGANYDEGFDIATDANGNVLVTGFFASPTVTFGTTTLTNVLGLGNDIFIVKFNANGNMLWAKSAGGNSVDYGLCITTDANGDVLVTGTFASSVIIFGTDTLTNAGGNDIFIVKYNPSGTVLWAKSASGANNDYGTNIATDANGNVLVTGNFASPTITFGTTTLTGAGGLDIFIIKYDASGNVLWAKSVGETQDDYNAGMAIDANGNVLITGGFYSATLTFGVTTLTNSISVYGDMYVAKLGIVTGITEQNNRAQALYIYPNPANSHIVIRSSENFSRIKILNTFMQVSLQKSVPYTKLLQINTTSLSAGVYFVIIDDKYVRKLIVEK